MDVQLVHAASLAPSASFERIAVRIVAEPSEKTVHETTFAPRELGDDVLDLGDLHEGASYRVEVRADAPAACANGRAVGRSVTFMHREATYVVGVPIGCVDAFSETRGAPSRPRFGHALVTTSDGEATLVGGARSGEPTESQIGFSGMEPLVERYDPRSGRFFPSSSLAVPRAFPAVVALADGAVGVAGGYTGDGFGFCGTAVEIVRGQTTSSGESLAYGRCNPSAVRLHGAERVAVVGGQAEFRTRLADVEILDEGMRGRAEGSVATDNYRMNPALLALADGASALSVGGVAPESPHAPVVRLTVGTECMSAACAEIVQGDTPAEGFKDHTATYVPCDDGTGAVYIVGGETGPRSAPLTLPDVLCYRDDGSRPGSIVRVGALDRARRQHETVLVRGGPTGHRLLVMGGLGSMRETSLPYSDALLVPVNGCACEAIDGGAIVHVPLNLASVPILLSGTVLPDGSVLIVGGLQITQGSNSGLRYEATGESRIFFPELP